MCQAVIDAHKEDALRKKLAYDENAFKKNAINEKLKVKYYQDIKNKLKAVCNNELSLLFEKIIIKISSNKDNSLSQR